jgi:hypothetical protein
LYLKTDTLGPVGFASRGRVPGEVGIDTAHKLKQRKVPTASQKRGVVPHYCPLLIAYRFSPTDPLASSRKAEFATAKSMREIAFSCNRCKNYHLDKHLREAVKCPKSGHPGKIAIPLKAIC